MQYYDREQLLKIDCNLRLKFAITMKRKFLYCFLTSQSEATGMLSGY